MQPTETPSSEAFLGHHCMLEPFRPTAFLHSPRVSLLKPAAVWPDGAADRCSAIAERVAHRLRLFEHVAPQSGRYRLRQCRWWDFPDLKTWPQMKAPVRAIRSLETYSVRRQIDKQDDPQTSDWLWVATLSPTKVSVERAVHLGHQRWDIENYAFNELVTEWHSDHVFKRNSTAIECFLLVAFLAYNIFHAFLALNVKPAARQGKTQVFWAKLIAAELYGEVTPAGLSP